MVLKTRGRRRGVPFVMGIAVALYLAAGSLAAPAQQVDTSRYKKAPPYVIGVSNVSVANTFRVQMIAELRAARDRQGQLLRDIVITDAGGSASKQISDIEDLITQGVDALLVAPASATAVNPAVEEAHAAGIPVVIFNTDIASDKVTSRVLPPYRGWARQAAEWLAKQIGGKGNVIALRGIAGLAAEADEWAGVQEVLSKHPGIRVACVEYADWDYAKAKTAVANCLANRPKVDGVLSIGDGMTWAAAEVLNNMGYPVAKIPMTGIGGSNGFLKYWKAHNLNAYVIADPTSISVSALNVALAALQGKPVNTLEEPPTYVIANDNLARYVKPSLPDTAWVGTELSETELKSLLGK